MQILRILRRLAIKVYMRNEGEPADPPVRAACGVDTISRGPGCGGGRGEGGRGGGAREGAGGGHSSLELNSFHFHDGEGGAFC